MLEILQIYGMCGITGMMAFNEVGRMHLIHLENATRALQKRGPDHQNTFFDQYVGLGHRRLSILDTSVLAHQPMHDHTGRYTLIYNGEIYNFRAIRDELQQKGVEFRSAGDTEVLLYALIQWGKEALQKLNGFFAFAFYDNQEGKIIIARDRLGIKPLLYYFDEDKVIFASEMKSVLAYNLPRTIDQAAFHAYFQLNYTPAPLTMIAGVNKLMPGSLIEASKGSVLVEKYYHLPKPSYAISDYGQACNQLEQLLDDAVQARLIADVPFGTFLSGGIDSSVISTLASRHTDNLNTFSIGFKDQPYFDESNYALLVAKKINSQHHQISLATSDMLEAVEDILDYIDEPFADSSAIPVYILSRETRKYVTVALSGDGADELFAGYNKHAAWLKSLTGTAMSNLAVKLAPIWQLMPKSRSSKIGNLFRQLDRYAQGMQLSPQERYWLWASISTPSTIRHWQRSDLGPNERYIQMKSDYLSEMADPIIGNFLHTDARLVLPNDMLAKVDLMSMANSLEVRVPFLDHRVVAFAFSLQDDFKITPKIRKRIVQDTFRHILPSELYNRPKHGFEVPLLYWLRHELQSKLDDSLFNTDFLQEQGIFNPSAIMQLRKKLHSFNPGDSAAQVWALYVFQHWFRRFLSI